MPELSCHDRLRAWNAWLTWKIIRFARKESSDLANGLVAEGYKHLLLGLAVSTSHLESISDRELAWILNEESEGTYGVSKNSLGYSFGCREEDEVLPFPEYTPEPELTSSDGDNLDRLEKRHILQIDDLERTNFTHPFYRSAAESLFREAGRREFKNIERALRKGIFVFRHQPPEQAQATFTGYINKHTQFQIKI